MGTERVERGTTAYLDELLHHDQRFVNYLRDHPHCALQLARGEVHVQYDLVRVMPGGGVEVQAFMIDVGGLHSGDLHHFGVRAG